MHSVVHLRISDNVLSLEDFPVVEATIEDGIIVKLEQLRAGSTYRWNGMSAPYIGMNLHRLLKWLYHDSTGHHPESYNEICFPPYYHWTSIYTMVVLQKKLEECAK